MDVPEDISDFEGEEGDHESSVDESNTDSGESDKSASEIDHADISPSESGDSDSDVQGNETTISTRKQSRPHGRGVYGTTARGARLRFPANRHDADNSAIRWEILMRMLFHFLNTEGSTALFLFWKPTLKQQTFSV